LVSVWADKSANGYDFIQGVAGKYPTTDLYTQNGLNSLYFDQTDFLYNTANASSLWSTTGTWFVAARSRDAANYGFLLYAKNGSAGQEAGSIYNGMGYPGTQYFEVHVHFDNVSQRPSCSYQDSDANATTATVYRNNTATQKVVGMRYRPSDYVDLICDNTANLPDGLTGDPALYLQANAATGTNTPTWWGIGAHGSTDTNLERYLFGEVFEIIKYDRYLTDTEVAQTTLYLEDKWNL
jgi:hypothetical protein